MRLDWILQDYIDGRQLTSIGQRRYALAYGAEMRACAHCYHVEDGQECCICYGTGLTDDGWWWIGTADERESTKREGPR